MSEKSITELIAMHKKTSADLANLAGQLSTFINQQGLINKEQSEFRQRMLHYMQSDPTTGSKGFIEEQTNLKSRIDSLESDRSKIIGGALGISFIIGIFFKWIGKFI